MVKSKCSRVGFILWICVAFHQCMGLSTQRNYYCSIIAPAGTALLAAARDYDHEGSHLTSCRRKFLTKTASELLVASGSIAFLATSRVEQAVAVVDSGDVIWKTGRAPIIPGKASPADKGDVKGTKKDPNFLRSVADCKGKCENGLNSDGLARSASECLQACQDICCTTYEQCTFTIVR